jgi:DUF971 family protein
VKVLRSAARAALISRGSAAAGTADVSKGRAASTTAAKDLATMSGMKCVRETDIMTVRPDLVGNQGEDILAESRPWPTELRLRKDRKALTIAFDSGETFELPAEYLRVTSPSAEVQGHSPDERKTVAGKKDVGILQVHPVGNYAVRLVFDDMHSTGIFSWDYFIELGRDRERRWQDYLDELAGKGLSREAARR